MAAKRKAAALTGRRDNPSSSPAPRKRRCRKYTAHISCTDPFRCLNFDCASIIFEYLDPVSIVRCERVDKAWRKLMRLWICTLGLRVHFPDAWNPKIKQDENVSVKVYKEQAAPFATFPAGRASAGRKISAYMKLFTVAGDYAAWYDGRHIHWQDLSFRADGSLRPTQTLKLELKEDEDLAQIESLRLNKEGCLLIRALPMVGMYKDFLVDLNTGKIKWRRDELATVVLDPIGDCRILRPVLLGAERAYYVNDRVIAALDINSGALLYETPLHNVNWEDAWHIETFGRKCLSESHSALVKLAGREVFVGIIPVHNALHRSSILQIMDSETGNVLQQIPFTRQDRTTLLVSPDQRGFAVVDNTPDFKALIIRKFTPTPDGRFFAQHLQLVDHRTKVFGSLVSTPVAVDPFRSLVVLIDEYHEPRVAALIEREGALNKTMQAHKNIYGTKGNVLFKGMHREVTLPPTRTGGPRRSFLPNDRMHRGNDILHVHLLDGHRAVIETNRWVPRPSWSEALTQCHNMAEYMILDFKLRPGQVHPCDEDSEQTTPETSLDDEIGFLFR
ncbi:uncharacterized protein BDW70DRAFT_152209 [Aspergillus foveolatus]|uniref:uncharacterized protein n=1 Tax=Aspergillus foveolatus TaxID=210207 RepID=UPI003CCC9082